MAGDELAVQQQETPGPQACDQMDQGDLLSVGLAAEHAFAEERAADPHSVKPTDQNAVVPNLDRMGVAALVQCHEQAENLTVDPGVGALFR